MDQEVMNQLSEEVLRLDTRIDNVSDDLYTLENKVNSLNNDAINQRVNDIANDVDNLDASVSTKVRALENQASNFSSTISNLQNEDKGIRKAMNDMDVEHHEELHRLALSVDNHESRIDVIETHWINYEGEIERIDNKIDASIDDLKNEIDDVSTGLSNVTTIVNNLQPHIVLTKKEYDDLENPDYNSFYFTYEDENSI